MNTRLGVILSELEGLNAASLRVKYAEVFGEQARSSNRQFLFRRIAWQLQARTEGGLSERVRQRAAEIADDADLRTRAPKGFLAAQPKPAPTGSPSDRSRSRSKDWRMPLPGSVITRRLEGREVVVKVLAQGFEYESRRYRSLSAIAREITGTRWNGLRFFGLTEDRHA